MFLSGDIVKIENIEYKFWKVRFHKVFKERVLYDFISVRPGKNYPYRSHTFEQLVKLGIVPEFYPWDKVLAFVQWPDYSHNYGDGIVIEKDKYNIIYHIKLKDGKIMNFHRCNLIQTEVEEFILIQDL